MGAILISETELAITTALRIACEQDTGLDPSLLDDLPAMVRQLIQRSFGLRQSLEIVSGAAGASHRLRTSIGQLTAGLSAAGQAIRVLERQIQELIK